MRRFSFEFDGDMNLARFCVYVSREEVKVVKLTLWLLALSDQEGRKGFIVLRHMANLHTI